MSIKKLFKLSLHRSQNDIPHSGGILTIILHPSPTLCIAHILTIQIRDTFEYILLRACARWRRHDELYIYIEQFAAATSSSLSNYNFVYDCVCVCVSCLCINKVFFFWSSFLYFSSQRRQGHNFKCMFFVFALIHVRVTFRKRTI